jgi:L-ascorbate metabolism protein UlaG (beta-lactamase superfamily)
LSWRSYTDWAKRKPVALRVAARLGRGRGRLRVIDWMTDVQPARLVPNLSGWENQELAAIWIGHATVLLRIGGMTILTDPVFSPRVGVGMGIMTAGPKRFIAPAIALRKLPKIDLILVSHAHFDHLDRPTLDRLPKSTPVITSHHNADLINDLGYKRVTELQWGQSIELNGLRVTGCEVKHWGARTFYDHHRGYCAFLLEHGKRRILYGADTAYGEHFRDIGKVDLACLGIGAYDPYIAAHATPEQALAMGDDVRADHILPMHHSTFKLSHEPMNEPIERILTAAGRDTSRIIIREVGGQWALN